MKLCRVCNEPLKRKHVYIGYTYVHDDQMRKCCDLCLKPLDYIELGKNKFPIWLHKDGSCKAIRTSYNFAKTIMRRLNDFKRHVRYEMIGNHVRRFRETRD